MRVNKSPTAEELAQQRHEMGNMLLAVAEQTAPLFDAADGMRADLAKRGWSPDRRRADSPHVADRCLAGGHQRYAVMV